MLTPAVIWSHLHRTGRILSLLFILMSIALAGALITLRYWVLPDIEKYHHEVVTLVSRAVGLPLTIGKIEADWRGLRPHLVFNDVRLLDERGNSVLALRRIDNIVSWMTLLSRELRLHTLEIDDPDLLIRRDKQGLVYVAGLQISGQSADDKLADWLLHQARIIVRNGRVTWQDELYDRPLLVLNQAQLRVENSWRHHRFAVRITPPDTVAMPLDIRGNLVGRSFSDMRNWRGEVFAQIANVDVAVLHNWLTLPKELDHAQGDVRAWLGVEQGRLNSVTADLNMSEIQSRLAPELPPIMLDELRGRVAWRTLERGGEVSTQGLSLQMKTGFKLQPTDFYLRLAGTPENRLAAGAVRVNTIKLNDLAVMSDYLPLANEIKRELANFAPRGRISDMRVEWQIEANRTPHFEVKARFEDVFMRSVGKIPGVAGLTGEIDGSDGSGALTLNSPHLKLDASQLFLEPVVFDTLSGQASWQRRQDGWEVKLNNFTASNKDLAGTAYGNYQSDANGPGVADMTLNLSRASVRNVVRYLPKELLGKETMAWLQAGLLAGEASEAQLHLRGDLKDFPFADSKKGLFQVKAKTTGVVVDYEKGWPRVENATANLLIEGQRLQVDSTAATLAGAKAQKVRVLIPDYTSADAVLQIKGEASGETQYGLNFIKHSPVRDYIDGFTDNTTARGEGRLDLKLDIPLSDKPAKVKGRYRFEGNEIALDKDIPVARKVVGDLTFTETELQAKGISAQILGGPATISLQTDAGGALKAKLEGKANMDSWRKVNHAPVLQSLHGGADWGADISLQGKKFAVVVTSSLQGLSSDFPAPLMKSAQEIVPLKFELRGDSAKQDVMWLKYGELLSARLAREDNADGERVIKRGFINFGSLLRPQDKEGIWLTGVLPLLSLEGWQGVLQRDASTPSDLPAIDGVDMSVQKIVGYGSTINGLAIHARNRNGTIVAQLASKDLNGELSWLPQGKGKLVVRLKNAALGGLEKDKKAEVAVSPSRKSSSKASGNMTIPVIDVAVEHLSYRGNLLGRVELHASQFENDILLDSFRLTNPDGVLLMNGKWGASPVQTHIAAKLTLSDIGKVLGRSGYPNAVKNGSGSLDCDLVWAGAPNEFLPANLDGHLNLTMAKGEFLKLGAAAGKGFEFGNIAGVAKIRQGVVSTSDLKISGALADVALSGQVDLSRETQNLHARVTPNISSGVSLLAFAASPAVGAVVFIANKILRDPLDKLASFEYNVTGTWADPKVEKAGQAPAAPK